MLRHALAQLGRLVERPLQHHCWNEARNIDCMTFCNPPSATELTLGLYLDTQSFKTRRMFGLEYSESDEETRDKRNRLDADRRHLQINPGSSSL